LKKGIVLRFYSGAFTSRDIDEMEVEEFNQYFGAIRLIESKEIMTQLMIADFPHYKNGKRKEIHNKLRLTMQNGSSRANSTEEIARMLGALNG
tara:strand:+ start:307 stop:585 length:279 start_codon:yes stop_codon:yes gene_type:complete